MRKITEAVRIYAEENDMTFYSGFTKKMTDSRLKFPAIWMEPMQLAGKSGMNQGSITYKIKLHILRLDRNYTQAEMEKIWEVMQKDAIRLYDHLEQSKEIKRTGKLHCSPSESRLTNYGEVSMTLTFEADLFFCNNKGE